MEQNSKHMKKVIFLDIDGVLNHEDYYKWRYEEITVNHKQFSYPYSEFSPDSIKQLNRILKETDAEIILSSSWRFDDFDYLNNLFKELGIEKPIVDVTPSLYNVFNSSLCRGKEIDKFLSEHPDIDRYVILDDDSDMEPHQFDYFVKTNAYKDGLNEERANKAIEILNGE